MQGLRCKMWKRRIKKSYIWRRIQACNYLTLVRYLQNRTLLDQLERTADALVAFQTKVDKDADEIRNLKEHLSSWELKYPFRSLSIFTSFPLSG